MESRANRVPVPWAIQRGGSRRASVFRGSSGFGVWWRPTVLAEDDTAVLDYDAHGRLLGIELFDAGRRLHPELLAGAERTDREPRPPGT